MDYKKSALLKYDEALAKFEQAKTEKENIENAIKHEQKERYYDNSDFDKIRHALSLHLGYYIKKYTERMISLDKARIWNNNKSYNDMEYANYWHIRHNFYNHVSDSRSEHVGNICFEKHYIELFTNKDFENIWKYYIDEERYIESLNTFKKEFSSKEKLFEAISKYNCHYKRNGLDTINVFTVVNKKLKIPATLIRIF